MTEVQEKAKKMFDRIKVINRYCGEDKAVKLVMIEVLEEIRKNPDAKYWEQIKNEVNKL